MYSDPVNKLYLMFLMPFLQDFNRINKLFQQDRGNTFKMLECLLLFFRSLISRVVRPGMISTSDELLVINITDPSVLLPVGAVNYGVTFMMASDEAMESTAMRNLKSRCRDFLVEAGRQVQQRPANIQIWKSMTVLLQSNCHPVTIKTTAQLSLNAEALLW